jgi:hypothetical protein
VSERDFTPEELQTLGELADLSESDPALYESIVSSASADAERQEHGEDLLGMIGSDGERRRGADRALLEALSRAHQAGAEPRAEPPRGPEAA